MRKFPSYIWRLIFAILPAINLLTASSIVPVVANQQNQIYLPLVLTPATHSPRVHVPYFDGNIRFAEAGLFWFGDVEPTRNYADVRVGYNDTGLSLRLSVFDRRLWYDPTPEALDLSDYDGASLYLNLDGPSGSSLARNGYKLVSQLNWWEARERWQAAYRSSGGGWSLAEIPFTTNRNWRGNVPNNDVDDRGWSMTFHIPFASLGLTEAPPQGTVWGLAIALHDRDDQEGTPISDQTWPLAADLNQPVTWGSLSFGRPDSTPSPASPSGSLTIRHGLNGAIVKDAHVGGHSICGQPHWPNFFDSWGSANYAGYDQINIQNQSDVADWPCFSKFYITFPLDLVPANKVLLDATLKLYLFGNAGMNLEPPPQPSLIQALIVSEDWDESTITWNNAPLALENVAQTWVNPIDVFPGWPGVPYEWDLSTAAAQAYTTGQPLRLVLYSADGAYNSGKYFISSDTGEWNEDGRPALTITWGEP